MYIIYGKKIAGPSAQWRVGITCGRSSGQRVLFSVVPRAFQPRNLTLQNGRSPFGNLLALQGSIFDGLWDRKFFINVSIEFCKDVSSMLDQCWHWNHVDLM